MKIVVIGGSHHIRTETIERLREKGHDAVAASLKSRAGFATAAPRDPGYAGRPLRELLERVGFVLHDLWLGRLQVPACRRVAVRPAKGNSGDDLG